VTFFCRFSVALGGLAMTEVVQKTTDRLNAIKAEGVHVSIHLSTSCICEHCCCVIGLILLGL
jgi:hypothetical protein